jgi:hypothetical protein
VVPPAPDAPQQGTVPLVTAEEGEDDGANDPVYVPPVPGTSQDTGALSCDTAEAEWANDPVYVPPANNETTLA